MELLIAVPSAFKGSVDFGPEVTSSDKSLKVLLNAEDKVRTTATPGWAQPGRAGGQSPGSFSPSVRIRPKLGRALTCNFLFQNGSR